MSIYTGVHLHDDSVIEVHNCSAITPGHGYLRLRPLPDSIIVASVIHAQAPELRRLAASCLALADELDPPARPYTKFGNDLALASYGAMHDREDDCPRMGENR